MTSINQYLFACPYLRPFWCFKVVHDRFCPEIRNEIITCMNVTKERKITVAVTADPLHRLTISLSFPKIALTGGNIWSWYV